MANALELRLFRTKPSSYSHMKEYVENLTLLLTSVACTCVNILQYSETCL